MKLNEILTGTGFTERTKALKEYYRENEGAFVYRKEFDLLEMVEKIVKEGEETTTIALIILNGLKNGHYAIRPGSTGKGYQEGISWSTVVTSGNKKLLKEAIGEIKRSTINKWKIAKERIEEIPHAN